MVGSTTGRLARVCGHTEPPPQRTFSVQIENINNTAPANTCQWWVRLVLLVLRWAATLCGRELTATTGNLLITAITTSLPYLIEFYQIKKKCFFKVLYVVLLFHQPVLWRSVSDSRMCWTSLPSALSKDIIYAI